MKLGERLRQARLEAGLSQRQLAGERITRSMLSQIENGSAVPSMETLRFLAERLEKPMGFFLDEGETDAALLERAWAACEADAPEEALQLAQQLPPGREVCLLQALALLRLARRGMEQGRQTYAANLLERVETLEESLAFLPELRERRLMLRAALRLPVEQSQLPNLDDRLYLHAYAAMRGDAPCRAAAYLDAAADRDSAQWHLLRARTFMAQGEYAAAAGLLRLEEKRTPGEAIPLLEQCFRELGDYQQAYRYACMQRR